MNFSSFFKYLLYYFLSCIKKITVIHENNENHTNTEIVETRVTDLGKKIDVIKIIKDYDPENISI